MKNYDDFSREADDRLCFLEVFFSASDNVSLLYTGRDSEFGNRLSPAAPIVELMEHLGKTPKTCLGVTHLLLITPTTHSGRVIGQFSMQEGTRRRREHSRGRDTD